MMFVGVDHGRPEGSQTTYAVCLDGMVWRVFDNLKDAEAMALLYDGDHEVTIEKGEK